MGVQTFIFLIIVCAFHVYAYGIQKEEVFCTSRFDFESKLLQFMIKTEFEMTQLKESYAKDIKDLKLQTKTAVENMEAKVTEITSLGNVLSTNIGDKIKEVDTLKQLQAEDFAKLYKNLEEKSDKKLQEIQDAAMKPTVAFQAKNVHTTSPTTSTTLRFTDVIMNTDNVYDPSSGEFTAPVNGTYVFAVQLCAYNKKGLTVRILADDVVLNIAYSYDTDGGHPCSTVNAMSVLTQGSHVYVQRGLGGSTGTIIVQDAHYYWATFMGSLPSSDSTFFIYKRFKPETLDENPLLFTISDN